MPRVRADQLLVERGLAASRHRAQLLIMAGQVWMGTARVAKPAQLLDAAVALRVASPARFVSRGGEKLQAALDAFGVDPSGRHCLDIGASTGGFSDCLLQAGAASVLAVDVGRAQLHQKLRDDPRVTLLEGTNARDLPQLPGSPGSPVELFVADLSFISLRKVLPSVAARLGGGVEGIVLLKPQFEAGPADVPRGGVIRDPRVRERVLSGFVGWLAAEGWEVDATMECPVRGGEGNIEYLVHLHTPPEGVSC